MNQQKKRAPHPPRNLQPREISGARICILRYSDETTVCANVEGFKSIGAWIGWLAESNPQDNFHVHLLSFLQSDQSTFQGIQPRNVWFLDEPKSESRPIDEMPADATRIEYELTFQVVTDAELDELVVGQESGIIPRKWLKN